MSRWSELIDAYRTFPGVSASLKIATIAQWIKESGRGESDLAQQHFNFGGLKYRGRMQGYASPVDYRGRDQVLTTYCAFEGVEDFLKGYWHFVRSGPYQGWEEHERDGAAFIRHLVEHGYCPEEGYAAHVIRLFDEARALLTRSQAAPEEEDDRVVLGRLAVLVGHNQAAPGARAVAPISQHEFAYNSKVAALMKAEAEEFNLEIEIFFRKPAPSYRQEIRDAYAKVAAWQPTCVLELHFNSTEGARGAEMLHAAGSGRSKALASHVLEEVLSVTGLRSRGLKPKVQGDRGAASLFALDVPTVLTEPFFGSSSADCVAMATLGQEALALAYLRGVRDWAMSARGVEGLPLLVAERLDAQPDQPVVLPNLPES